MPPAAAAPQPTSFDLKSAQWPVVALLLRGTDWALLQQDWAQRFGGSTEFFDHDPLLVDLSALPAEATPDLEALAVFLHAQRLRPLAYRGGSEAQRQAAERLGWACADEAQAWQAMACAPAPAAPPAVAPAPSVALATALVVDRPLRSGQQVYARGRDLIVTAMVNPGAEVVADGHIHVYAPLRGKAIAGARGDVSARIFARVLEAELVSIAGVYRTSEVPLPDEVRGKAAQIRLDSGEHGDRLLIEPLA